MSESNDTASRSGFLSEADKRTFTTIAGIIGSVFFVIQLLGPMLAVFAMMPVMMFRSGFQTYAVDGSALHQGEIYVVETARSFGWDGGQGAQSRVVRITDGKLEEVVTLYGWEPELLSDGERLWLVSSVRIASLVDGRLEPHPLSGTLGDICRPFLYQGAPAVIENRPDGARLLRWQGNDWEELRPVPELAGGCGVQALASDDVVWAFRRDGNTLYVQDVTAENPSWDVMLSEPSRWFALTMDGRPSVVSTSQQYGFRIVQHDGTGWTTVSTTPNVRTAFGNVAAFGDVAAFQERSGDLVFVVSEGFPGFLTVRMWDGQDFTNVERYGRSSFFPFSMMWLMTLPHLGTMLLSLLLAVILSSLMRKHRVTTYQHEGTSVPYASITRRALSQVVDVLILGLPALFVSSRMFGGFEEFFEVPGPPLRLFALMGLSVAWMIFGFVAYSLGEGLWGRTPGKWLLGIRVVGTDLALCGIGRAIIRNVLKFVDGFFNYLVGILLIAFTPEWQRVGDLAARTIVVRVEPRR